MATPRAAAGERGSRVFVDRFGGPDVRSELPPVNKGFGAYFVLGGRILVDLIIPSNRPYCPECGYDIRRMTGTHCPECGSLVPAELAPEPEPAPPASEGAPDAEARSLTLVERWVPIENRKALVGYYLGVAALVPIVGLFIGPVAVAYGVEGLRHAKRSPRLRGGAHSWAAIVLGTFTTLVNACGLCLLPWLGQLT